MANKGQGQVQIRNTALTANDATAQEQLGTIRCEQDETYGEKYYMYVLASGAIANGTVCAFNGVTGYTVGPLSTAGTGGAVGQVRAVGVGIGTITTAYYGWIEVRGHHTAILKSVTGPYCTTAYTELYYLSGKVRGAKYVNTTTWITASTAFVQAGITAYESLGSGESSLSGYIHCM